MRVRDERVLVTTLTKRMAEDLAEYYSEAGVRCQYLHSEVSTLDRIKILRDLRRGEFDGASRTPTLSRITVVTRLSIPVTQ